MFGRLEIELVRMLIFQLRSLIMEEVSFRTIGRHVTPCEVLFTCLANWVLDGKPTADQYNAAGSCQYQAQSEKASRT